MDHGEGESGHAEVRRAQLIGEAHAEVCAARAAVERAAAQSTEPLAPATRALLEWVDAVSALVGRLAIAERERIGDEPPRRVGRPRRKRQEAAPLAD